MKLHGEGDREGLLAAVGIRHPCLDGATPATERTRRVAAFQAGEGDLFLIRLKAGGVGLHLTAADQVVIIDPWWNPSRKEARMATWGSGRNASPAAEAHRYERHRPARHFQTGVQFRAPALAMREKLS
jgi:hypothetical protein